MKPNLERSKDPRRTIKIRATDYEKSTSGNIGTVPDRYGADVIVNIANPSGPGDAVEYTFPAVAAGLYRLKIEYSSAREAPPRPIDIFVNPPQYQTVAPMPATGGKWEKPDQKFSWVDVFDVQLKRGANHLRISRAGPIPHIRAIQFVPV